MFALALNIFAYEATAQWMTESFVELPDRSRGRVPNPWRPVTREAHINQVRHYVAALSTL